MKVKYLPRIVSADDYHILLNIPDDIEAWLGITVKCEELGYCNGYVGLIYQGKMPSKKEIIKLLKEEKITFEEEEGKPEWKPN